MTDNSQERLSPDIIESGVSAAGSTVQEGGGCIKISSPLHSFSLKDFSHAVNSQITGDWNPDKRLASNQHATR